METIITSFRCPWVDHVDQHVHLNKSGADVTLHWEHGRQ
jgi:hypothetical protein